MKFKDIAAFVVQRAQEPSTMAAVSAVSAMAGYHVDPGVAQNMLAALAMLFAGAAAVKKG